MAGNGAGVLIVLQAGWKLQQGCGCWDIIVCSLSNWQVLFEEFPQTFLANYLTLNFVANDGIIAPKTKE